jgi:hypothetical protein
MPDPAPPDDPGPPWVRCPYCTATFPATAVERASYRSAHPPPPESARCPKCLAPLVVPPTRPPS